MECRVLNITISFHRFPSVPHRHIYCSRAIVAFERHRAMPSSTYTVTRALLTPKRQTEFSNRFPQLPKAYCNLSLMISERGYLMADRFTSIGQFKAATVKLRSAESIAHSGSLHSRSCRHSSHAQVLYRYYTLLQISRIKISPEGK